MSAKRIIYNKTPYRSHGKDIRETLANFATFLRNECDGWSGKIWRDEDSGIHYMQAFRDDNEKIEIEWPTTTWPVILHTIANHTIKCRNVSHAAKIAYAEPDIDRLKRAAKRRRSVSRLGAVPAPSDPLAGENRPGRGPVPASDPDAATGDLGTLKSYVPFTKESTAEEVKQELIHFRNPSITWINRLTGAVATAMVKTRSKHFKVAENKAGQVIISFADEYGFKSVYAASVIGVQ